MFISPRYLLPADMGGKIRTAHVLKGLKGGHFDVTLISPAPPVIPDTEQSELFALCDRFLSWAQLPRGPLHNYTRLRYLVAREPVSVVTDWSGAAARAVASAIAGADLVVADFLHAAILLPEKLEKPSVLFTHNVEAEIFARHAELAKNPITRRIWQSQWQKMRSFEAKSLRRFDGVVAVSERDRATFQKAYGVAAAVIPTGVDLDHFAFHPPKEGPPVVAFTASMDSLANIDGVRWFLDKVWPLIVAEVPGAQMRVIGRNPDPGLVAETKRRGLTCHFTGSVKDVCPYLEDVQAYVIPLRAGGGTRIKAFEAMAYGLPVVSTSVGIEGLGVTPELHYLNADSPEAFAASVLRLLRDPALRWRLSLAARQLVEENYSSRKVGRVFEDICINAMQKPFSESLVQTPARGRSAA
ncbi:glycosyltransferase family 4 protein [Rhizomicrobium palustre]